MGTADDERKFDFYGFKQDWSLDLSDRLLLKWGMDYKRLSEKHYHYFIKKTFYYPDWQTEIIEYDTTSAKGDAKGNNLGVYLSNRFRITDRFTSELGLRYDYASWTDDKDYSPRVNFAYDLGRTTFRAGWGKFRQIQRIDNHNAQDGEKVFYYPSEQAEHRVIGLEHKYETGINVRIEAYQKVLSSIRPYYLNFEGTMVNPFAELHNDRIRLAPEKGESKGIEFYLFKDSGSKWSWWFSYGYAKAEEVINGIETPKYFDQRHTVYFDLNYRPARKWRINLAWNYHSGWPYTESHSEITKWYPDGHYDIEWVNGPINANRLPSYHRMDLRISRRFETGSGGISAFFEIRNIYNRKNIREYLYTHLGYWNNRTHSAKQGDEYGLPLVPSFGISWDIK
jgi:outer membrane receptor protein involved in Fe transport